MKILNSQDITALSFRVDVIVNSANPNLLAGGGVCGAIHQAAGPNLEKECQAYLATLGYKKRSSGTAVATTAGNLNAEWVIHAVAPIYDKDFEKFDKDKLEEAYYNSLRVALRLGAKSIAFPLLGAGIYGWPHEKALQIATEQLKDSKLEAYLCLFP